MGTTPNFGWTYPAPTNYVKDLPTDLGDLADEIDATVAGLGSGLNLVTAQPFTTASTIDVLGCFSSTYTNYLMTINFTAASTTSFGNFQFLSGSTPATSAYYTGMVGYTSSGSATNYSSGGAAGSSYCADWSSGGIYASMTKVTLFNPNLNSVTNYQTSIVWDGGGSYVRLGGGFHNTAASYTGLRFNTNAGTVTGTIRIYGLENS